MRKKVQAEYEEIKRIKQLLQAFRLETSGEVPLGITRYEPDHDVNDVFGPETFYQQNDPDKWPSPVPVVHSSR